MKLGKTGFIHVVVLWAILIFSVICFLGSGMASILWGILTNAKR